MKDNYTDITIVIDRSGSMNNLRDDVIGGINSFVEDQKKATGTATMTMVQFDDQYQVDYVAKDIHEVEPLTYETYRPRGMTALLDAIGKTIVITGERLRELPEDERPDKVIFIIQTDGEENNSTEFNVEQVKSMIEVQQNEFSWEVVFMGANIDAVGTAQTFGIKVGNAMTFGANAVGTQSAFRSVSKNVSDYRMGCKADMTYTSADINAQKDAGVDSQ